jgi:lipopolysaccharide transport system permease protein
MNVQTASLLGLFRALFVHRNLCWRLAAREFTQRFRGSMLGIVWAVLTPLLTAMVFTLVFTGVFPTRWGGGSGSPFDFALLLLVGLGIYGLFSEALSRAPTLLANNAAYVTKVVFPLEVLPLVPILTGLVNLFITIAIVLLGHLVVNGTLHWTALFLPVVLLPFVLFLMAAVIFVAAAGVFIRDAGLIIAPLLTFMLFLSPVFFPLEAVPESWRFVVRLNPLTPIISQARTVLIFGGLPDFVSLVLYMLCALASLAFAYWVFQRLRRGFADVL